MNLIALPFYAASVVGVAVGLVKGITACCFRGRYLRKQAQIDMKMAGIALATGVCAAGVSYCLTPAAAPIAAAGKAVEVVARSGLLYSLGQKVVSSVLCAIGGTCLPTDPIIAPQQAECPLEELETYKSLVRTTKSSDGLSSYRVNEYDTLTHLNCANYQSNDANWDRISWFLKTDGYGQRYIHISLKYQSCFQRGKELGGGTITIMSTDDKHDIILEESNDSGVDCFKQLIKGENREDVYDKTSHLLANHTVRASEFEPWPLTMAMNKIEVKEIAVRSLTDKGTGIFPKGPSVFSFQEGEVCPRASLHYYNSHIPDSQVKSFFNFVGREVYFNCNGFLSWNNQFYGKGDQVTKVQPHHMSSDIMWFIDSQGRPGVSFLLNNGKKESVITLFQRHAYKNGKMPPNHDLAMGTDNFIDNGFAYGWGYEPSRENLLEHLIEKGQTTTPTGNKVFLGKVKEAAGTPHSKNHT